MDGISLRASPAHRRDKTTVEEPVPTQVPVLGGARLITMPARPRHGPSDKQMRHLAKAAMLEEKPPPRLLFYTIAVVGLLIFACLAWAAMTEVRSTAMAQGQVTPSGSVRIVQHLEGGIVEEILAEEGDIVESGAVLVRLDPTAVLSQLDQLRSRLASLSLRSARLRALLNGMEPDFSTWGEDYPLLAADQLEVFETELASAEDERAILRSQIDQRREEVSIDIRQIESLAEQVAIMEEQLAIRQQLYRQGVGSRVVALDTERETIRARGELARAEAARRQTELAIVEAERALAEFETTRRREASQELSEVNAELAEVREAVEGLEDRLRRLSITAPVRGIVSALEVTTIGQVIEPGQSVLTLVPQDEAIVVETRITPSDIGFIEPGQLAEITVDGFPANRYGQIEGQIQRISATSFETEDGHRHYTARIALQRDYLEFEGNGYSLQPGMTVTVAITTGSQSILQYILRPVVDSIRRSFAER